MEKQWDRKVVGKARERNAEKKKKLQVKPAEAGGRSFQQQGMLYFWNERHILLIGVGVNEASSHQLFFDFANAPGLSFSRDFSCGELFSTLLNSPHSFFQPIFSRPFPPQLSFLSPLPPLLNGSRLPTSFQPSSILLSSSRLLPRQLTFSERKKERQTERKKDSGRCIDR